MTGQSLVSFNWWLLFPLNWCYFFLGIFSQPSYSAEGNCGGNCTYIPASYVQHIESAGARVVPIDFYATPTQLEHLFDSLNGFLFPGIHPPTVFSFETCNNNQCMIRRRIYYSWFCSIYFWQDCGSKQEGGLLSLVGDLHGFRVAADGSFSRWRYSRPQEWSSDGCIQSVHPTWVHCCCSY